MSTSSAHIRHSGAPPSPFAPHKAGFAVLEEAPELPGEPVIVPDGRVYPAHELQAMTEANLSGEIATIVRTAGVVRELPSRTTAKS